MWATPPARPRTHSGLREGALCRPRDGGLSPSLPGAARLRATVSFYVVEGEEDRVHVILAAVSGGRARRRPCGDGGPEDSTRHAVDGGRAGMWPAG